MDESVEKSNGSKKQPFHPKSSQFFCHFATVAARMSSSKKQSSKEDEPMQRVLRQRELVESMKHENEVLRLDLVRESRDVRGNMSTGATADISRYIFSLFCENSAYIRVF